MSQYAREIKHILATLNEQGSENDASLPDEEELDTIHVYPVEGGGMLFTRTPLEPEEAVAPPVIDSQDDHTIPAPAPAAKTPPPLAVFLLLLCVFVLGDLADTRLIALMTPTATITITPEVRNITLQSTVALGKLLSPITLIESQTVPTTGHGHQDARAATGTVTLYNGLFTSQFIAQGTMFTGSDGVNIVTTESATIPSGNPSTGYGTVTVTAQAQQKGAAGNIASGDIHIKINSGLLVSNNQFSNGRDERDYLLVTKSDRDIAAASLQARVTASMTAALHGQLLPGQALQAMPCPPATTADPPGEEATHLTVTVSETCTAVAYDMQQLRARATHLLTTRAITALGTGYALFGDAQVTVTRAAATPTTSVVAFACSGTYVYMLNAQAQQRIKALLAGKPRRDALRLLLQQPGIHTASIIGIAENQPLPDDLTHIRLLIVLLLF